MSKNILRFSSLSIITLLICLLVFALIDHLSLTFHVLGLLDDLICDMRECSTSRYVEGSPQWDSEVHRYIQSELSTRGYGRIHFNRYDVDFWRTVDGEMTYMIQSTTDGGLALFGSLMVFYGTPCSVTFTEDDINLQYSDFYVVIEAEYDLANPATLQQSLTPFMRVAGIGLLDANLTCETPLTFATSRNIVTEWHGFSSVEFYISQKSR